MLCYPKWTTNVMSDDPESLKVTTRWELSHMIYIATYSKNSMELSKNSWVLLTQQGMGTGSLLSWERKSGEEWRGASP